jgi:hypothetical protein
VVKREVLPIKGTQPVQFQINLVFSRIIFGTFAICRRSETKEPTLLIAAAADELGLFC